MASLAELAGARTPLDERAVDHLQRLVGAWALLADLSFSDLLVYAPCNDAVETPADGAARPPSEAPADGAAPTVVGEGRTPAPPAGFIVLAHVRCTTGPTVYPADPVGALADPETASLLGRAMAGRTLSRHSVTRRDRWTVGEDDVVTEQIRLPGLDYHLIVDCVPVRVAGEVAAVLTRQSGPSPIGHSNPLAATYRALYDRFTQMIADGCFPYDRFEQIGEFREPRVGDGVMVVDREGRVEYLSPNATSALNRLGVIGAVTGRRLDDVGLDGTVIRRSFARRRSTVSELEQGPHLGVVVRSYPLVEGDRITGAVALLRDISELRHRDQLLMSKDATIQEIHHRVKNNLQTVSSLLRLQARRLASAEARAAVEQSVRRISSIALVHECLALDPSPAVDFDTIVSSLVQMVEEGFTTPERPVRIRVAGAIGEAPGELAMPLAVVLTELVQNAFDHGSPGGGEITLRFSRSAGALEVQVIDRGPGVADGFSLDRDAGLGLTIVRTFVVKELRGRIGIRAASDEPPRGTVVDVSVPVASAG